MAVCGTTALVPKVAISHVWRSVTNAPSAAILAIFERLETVASLLATRKKRSYLEWTPSQVS